MTQKISGTIVQAVVCQWLPSNNLVECASVHFEQLHMTRHIALAKMHLYDSENTKQCTLEYASVYCTDSGKYETHSFHPQLCICIAAAIVTTNLVHIQACIYLQTAVYDTTRLPTIVKL